MNRPHCAHPSRDGHLVPFHLLATVNSAAVNICILLCVWVPVFNSSFVYTTRSKIVGSSVLFSKSLSRVRLFETPWTAARQASLSITNFWSLLKLMSIELVMPSNLFILCQPLLLLPLIFPSIRVFSNEMAVGWIKFNNVVVEFFVQYLEHLLSGKCLFLFFPSSRSVWLRGTLILPSCSRNSSLLSKNGWVGWSQSSGSQHCADHLLLAKCQDTEMSRPQDIRLSIKIFPHMLLLYKYIINIDVVAVQLLSCVQVSVTPWTAARQLPLSFTTSPSLLKFMSIELVMLSNHLSSCCPLLLLPSIFSHVRVFSNELALCIQWPKYWSFSVSICSSNEYSGLIPFRIDWFNLLEIQGTLKSLHVGYPF